MLWRVFLNNSNGVPLDIFKNGNKKKKNYILEIRNLEVNRIIRRRNIESIFQLANYLPHYHFLKNIRKIVGPDGDSFTDPMFYIIHGVSKHGFSLIFLICRITGGYQLMGVAPENFVRAIAVDFSFFQNLIFSMATMNDTWEHVYIFGSEKL